MTAYKRQVNEGRAGRTGGVGPIIDREGSGQAQSHPHLDEMYVTRSAIHLPAGCRQGSCESIASALYVADGSLQKMQGVLRRRLECHKRTI
jgi:hypothetical protein